MPTFSIPDHKFAYYPDIHTLIVSDNSGGEKGRFDFTTRTSLHVDRTDFTITESAGALTNPMVKCSFKIAKVSIPGPQLEYKLLQLDFDEFQYNANGKKDYSLRIIGIDDLRDALYVETDFNLEKEKVTIIYNSGFLDFEAMETQ